MRSLFVVAFLALGLMATPAFAQDVKDVEKDVKKEEVEKEEVEKKEAAKLNIYEATVEGMT